MNKKIDQPQIIEVIRKLVASEGSQTAAAKALSISRPYLCDILKGRRDVSEKIAERLGYRRVMLFEQIREEK